MTKTRTHQVMSSSSLTGDDIRNPKNDTLGSVHDIMIDCESGRVAYVVLSSGGFLGMGNKLFAIPMSALTLDTECECLRLDADKDAFDEADGFDKDNWPDMADTQWQTRTHERFGARPYWQG